MNNRGFTLIEVLIALAIIAIALLALTIAIDRVVKMETYLKQKTDAMLLAENIIHQTQAGIKLPEHKRQTSQILGMGFNWYLTSNTTPTPGVSLITVRVFALGDKAPLLTLWGFST